MNNELSKKIFIPFSSACLLFDAEKQSVLVLNQMATFIYCASFEVSSRNELVCFLRKNFSISQEQAQQDITQFYHNIEKNSLFLSKKIKQTSFLRAIKSTSTHSSCKNNLSLVYFSVHQNTFSLSLPTKALKSELFDIYAQFIASFQNKITDKINYAIHVYLDTKVSPSLFYIDINQQCVVKHLLLENIVPYIFGIIFETTWRTELNRVENECSINDQDRSLMFHAAVLAKNKKAVLFPAESGAGKSTLSAVLATKGWDFFTDELAIIKPEQFSVSPCPLSVCVKEGAVDFLCAYYPQLKNLTQYQRLDNKKVRYLPVKTAQLSTLYTKVAVIIFPFYNKEINCECHFLDKEEALIRFLKCGSSGRPMNHNELISVVKFIEKTPCYSLLYSNINQALKEIELITLKYFNKQNNNL